MKEKKDCIIHISDLHIDNLYDDEGNLREESWSNVKPEFFSVFFKNISKILSKENLNPISLIVSGDLSNTSEEDEYKRVEIFLNEFVKMSVPLENILIIPGNHDINWDLCKTAFKKYKEEMNKKGFDWTKGSKPFSFMDEKFLNFSNFFSKFFSKKKLFNPSNAIVDKIHLSKYNLLLIGFNSMFKESHSGEHFGWIEKNNLENELKEIDKEFSKCHKIGILHHNIVSFDKTTERYLKNWGSLQNTFLESNIYTFFFGHQHSSGSKTEDFGEYHLNYCEVGSLARKDVICYFNLYILGEDKKCLTFKRIPYHFIESSQPIHDETGYWDDTEDGNKTDFIICDKKLIKTGKLIETKTRELINESTTGTKKPRFSHKQTKELSLYSQNLFDIIKTYKSYKTGHFHWTEYSRTINWLDTSVIYKKHNYLNLAKASIIELINANSLDFDIAIALGIEGNLLASQLSYYYKNNYTYIPYKYRDPDHLKSEKLLTNNGFKNVIIIDQIVHKATSVKRLIELENDFFEKVENIYLISLFYCGEEEYNPNMFEKFESRLKFFMVCDKLKVHDCPRQKEYDFKKHKEGEVSNIVCSECENHLNEIVEFYSKVEKDENN